MDSKKNAKSTNDKSTERRNDQNVEFADDFNSQSDNSSRNK